MSSRSSLALQMIMLAALVGAMLWAWEWRNSALFAVALGLSGAGCLWCVFALQRAHVRERELAAKVAAQRDALGSAHDEAELASTAKSAFLANMSHELRTPLNAIIGYAELITEELEERDDPNTQLDAQLDAQLGQDVERILGSARRLLGLINDILDISKIEAGEIQLELRPVDIRELVDQAVRQVGDQITRRENTLTIEVPDELEPFESDPAKLRQIIINLLGNAAKFTEQGSITIRVTPDASRERPTLDVAIIDTGIGISQDRLEQLFEPFVQAEDSIARRFGGTGLGLTISRHFASMLGGRIVATSEPKRGSTFTLSLPLGVHSQRGQR